MSTEEIEAKLMRASDHDPHRLHESMWPAIEALAEAADLEIPQPMVTKTIVLRVDARFPADGTFERTITQRVLEMLGNEFMEGDGKDLMGYDGPFIHQVSAGIAD